MLNILHFHINDMSDEVSIDQRWLDQEERDCLMSGRRQQIRFPEFKRDANGMLLRYLILIHDQKVIDILYKPGEHQEPESIRYREYRINQDEYYTLQFGNSNKYQYGRITNIPYRMISSENKQHVENIQEGNCKNPPTAHCQARTFIRLEGYVDIDLLSMDSLATILDEPRKISAVVCKLTQGSMHQQMVYESLKQAKEQEALVDIQEKIDTFSAITQS